MARRAWWRLQPRLATPAARRRRPAARPRSRSLRRMAHASASPAVSSPRAGAPLRACRRAAAPAGCRTQELRWSDRQRPFCFCSLSGSTRLRLYLRSLQQLAISRRRCSRAACWHSRLGFSRPLKTQNNRVTPVRPEVMRRRECRIHAAAADGVPVRKCSSQEAAARTTCAIRIVA